MTGRGAQTGLLGLESYSAQRRHSLYVERAWLKGCGAICLWVRTSSRTPGFSLMPVGSGLGIGATTSCSRFVAQLVEAAAFVKPTSW